MARKKFHKWSEAELIDAFGLTKIKFEGELLNEWLTVDLQQWDAFEQRMFDKILHKVVKM